MKKRTLIEPAGLQILTCDNPNCDFEQSFKELTPEEMSKFIGCRCPQCDQNLLTKEDHEQYLSFLKVVNWINKWLGWITIFYSKKTIDDNTCNMSVHCHDGIKIKKESRK